jgi:phage baseplate assembly protein W|tara:strand:+ start:803 stop:1198 length:396 start_codon:yes stop_codon:yes gene_type:complete
MPIPSEIIFSDFQLNLTPHPVTRDLVIATNEDAVKRSVKNLILTNFHERPFDPILGSDVTYHLFENFSPITESIIYDGIEEVLQNYEPRVELLNLRVKADEDQNGFNCTIEFRIINQVEPLELDIFIKRVR